MLSEVDLRAGDYLLPARQAIANGRIFLDLPFSKELQDDVKNMQGRQYHGYDGANHRELVLSIFGKDQIWSFPASSRNLFQYEFLRGGDPYKRWDAKPNDLEISFERPLYPYQQDMVRCALTYKLWIAAAEMGLGKSLFMIEVIERLDDYIKRTNAGLPWVFGSKSSLASVEREFKKWEFRGNVELMTYDSLKKRLAEWQDGTPPPPILFGDESSLLKTPQSQRSDCMQHLADAMRREYCTKGRWWIPGPNDPTIILMSGSPAPKGPQDWWKQCEIVAPGFLREGDAIKLQNRCGLFKKEEASHGGTYNKRLTWLDDEQKCAICGQYENAAVHCGADEEPHQFQPSINEIAKLYRRMKGLVGVYFKRDHLKDLPEKVYQLIRVKPLPSTIRAAKLIAKSTPRAAEALIRLRELSDGFQYVDKEVGIMDCTRCKGVGEADDWEIKPEWDGVLYVEGELVKQEGDEFLGEDEFRDKYYHLVRKTCTRCAGAKTEPKIERVAEFMPCPKDDVLIERLDANYENGRLVTYAGFQGSVDRCVKIAQSKEWAVIRWDGRGVKVMTPKGETILGDPLEIFQNKLEEYPRVCFIGQGDAAGMGLTLTASVEIFIFSNTFSAQARIQLEDRIHRPGSRGALITDVAHLPTDDYVIKNLREKRDVQAMSLGDLSRVLEQDDDRVF